MTSRTVTVKVTSGCVALTLHVELDSDGDIKTNEVQIIKAELVEIDDELERAIYEKVQK